jgi:hypothetical protein
LEKAKKDLENFYKDYNEKKDKMKQQAAKEHGEAAKSQGAVSGDNVWVCWKRACERRHDQL